MKFKIDVGVYTGDDLVDTVSYVVPAEPLASSIFRIREDLDDVSLYIEGLEVLFE